MHVLFYQRWLLLSLKVVSATFLLVCFLSLKESTCQTKKNVSYFTSKAFCSDQILFSYSNVMMSSNAQE